MDKGSRVLRAICVCRAGVSWLAAVFDLLRLQSASLLDTAAGCAGALRAGCLPSDPPTPMLVAVSGCLGGWRDDGWVNQRPCQCPGSGHGHHGPGGQCHQQVQCFRRRHRRQCAGQQLERGQLGCRQGRGGWVRWAGLGWAGLAGQLPRDRHTAGLRWVAAGQGGWGWRLLMCRCHELACAWVVLGRSW